jgi:hypothetical protein
MAANAVGLISKLIMGISAVAIIGIVLVVSGIIPLGPSYINPYVKSFNLTEWHIVTDPSVMLEVNYTAQVVSTYNDSVLVNFTLAYPNGYVWRPSEYIELGNGTPDNWTYLSMTGGDYGTTPMPGTYLLNVSDHGKLLFQKSFTFSGANVSLVGFAYGTPLQGNLSDFGRPDVSIYEIYPVLYRLYNNGDLPVYLAGMVSYSDNMQGGQWPMCINGCGSVLFSSREWLLPHQCYSEEAEATGGVGGEEPVVGTIVGLPETGFLSGTYKIVTHFYTAPFDDAGYPLGSLLNNTQVIAIPGGGVFATFNTTYNGTPCT